MTLSALHSDPSPIPLASRRSNLHLLSSPLDPNWARELSDCARSRAYPSPPMSGSPLKPSRHDSDFDDRGHAGFGQPPQTRTHAQLPSQTETRDAAREPPPATSHNNPGMPMQYSSYQPGGGGGMPAEQSQYQYPPQPSAQLPAPPMPPYGFDHPRHANYPFQMAERAETAPAAKTRKTKGHVASACVPCKRAHLRCDAQRPCSRCQSNNKEDACIDMVHKKRGRPRLRDDHSRFDPSPHPPPHDPLRRPPPNYPTSSPPSEPPTRSSSSYRILKSQAPPPLPRYLDHASSSDANLYGPPAASRPPDPAALYLTLSLRIARASSAFTHATGILSPVARFLPDILAPTFRGAAARLQRVFDDLRQAREPHFLPPIFGAPTEEARVIAAASMGEEDVSRVPIEAREVLGFQGAGGEVRAFEVGVGLGRREGTFFVVLRLLGAVQVQSQPQTQMGAYRGEQMFVSQSQGQSQSLAQQRYAQQSYQPARSAFGSTPQSLLGQSQPQSGFTPSQGLGLAQLSQGQGQGQTGYAAPPPPPPSSRGEQLLLPPIRMREGEGSGGGGVQQQQQQERGRRSSRVDIGGLIEGPEGR